jgi:PKD repeat protein
MKQERETTKTRTLMVLIFLGIVLLVSSASAYQITVDNAQISGVGNTATVNLVLDDAVVGIAGYNFTFSVADPSVGRITAISFPAWATMHTNTTLPAGSVTYTTLDLMSQIQKNATNVPMGTFTIEGLSPGTTQLNIVNNLFSADGGNKTFPVIQAGTLTVYAVPTAGFAADTVTPIVGQTVTFTDQSTPAGNPISTYAWNFGDGTTSALQSPTHAYTATGTYTVTLTVTNPAGSDSETKTGYIVVVTETPPVAAFSATPMYGTAPLAVTFADLSTGTPGAWNWEYRASGTSNAWTSFATTQNPTYSFAAGAYDIRLTATNGGGSNTATKTQFISSSAGAKRLTTATSGTVSGDLYVGANGHFSTTTSYATNTAEDTFTLPAAAVSNVQWARLYTVVYGSSGDNRTGTATVSFDGNGDGTYETILGTETLSAVSDSTSSVYPVNNHVDKQYTDYQAQYDVTSLITSASPKAKVVAAPVTSTFDARIKDVVLVVAYNDGDSDVVRYWVNDGFDYQTSSGSAVTSSFATSSLTSAPTSATLQNVGLATQDAIYTFNTNSLSRLGSGLPSFETNSWNVKSYLTASTDSSFVYLHNTSSSYKTTLATLKARYVTAPTAAFTESKGESATNPASVAGTVTFTSTSTIPSTNTAATYAWDFGDGATSTVQNPTHSYAAAGTYTVTLVVTNEGGSGTATKSCYVTDMPIISFTPVTSTVNTAGSTTYNITMDNAPAGLSGYNMYVTLADGSVADITAVTYPSWAQLTTSPTVPADKVRIGGVDTNQKIYPGTTGPYTLATITVKGVVSGSSAITLSDLTMDDDSGNAITAVLNTGTIIVGSYSGPTAAFSATPVSGSAPLAVAFDSSTSTGTIATYQWDFDNDGVIDSTDANPTNTYSALGTYSVKLTVTGPGGSNTLLRNTYITVGDGTVPTVAIVANTTGGNYPLPVAFTATTTGNVTSYAWNFGDGTHSTLAAPTHTYTYPATFTVTLTITGPGGSAIDTGTILVTQNAPVAGIVANPTSGTAPLYVQFTDASTGTFSTYNWSFGDGTYSDLANPAHTFTSAGSYIVTHTVSGSAGTSAAATTTITATGLGVSFTSDKTTGVASAEHALAVTFTGTATPAATAWNWSFGDGTFSTEQNPVHNYYGHLKSFTVTLTAWNGADTASVTKSGYITTTPYLEAFPKTYDELGNIQDYYTVLPAEVGTSDYVYEDINANGRVDYNDVVTFFNAYETPITATAWLATNTDVDNAYDYDYSGNGALGYEDIVSLNDKILYS